MLVGAGSPGGAVVNGKLWVIGGALIGSGHFCDNTQIYDPVTNSWSNGPALNTARSFADAVTLNVVGGQMPIIVGGYTPSISLSSVEANLSGLLRVNSNTDSHGNPNSNAHCDGNSYGHCNSYCNTYRDANSDSYCNSDADANCHAYSDSDT